MWRFDDAREPVTRLQPGLRGNALFLPHLCFLVYVCACRFFRVFLFACSCLQVVDVT